MLSAAEMCFFTNGEKIKNKSPSLLVDSAAYCKAFDEIERSEEAKKKHKNEHTPVDISYYVFNFGTIVGEQRCARIQRLRSHDRIFHDNVRYKHIWLLKTSS